MVTKSLKVDTYGHPKGPRNIQKLRTLTVDSAANISIGNGCWIYAKPASSLKIGDNITIEKDPIVDWATSAQKSSYKPKNSHPNRANS